MHEDQVPPLPVHPRPPAVLPPPAQGHASVAGGARGLKRRVSVTARPCVRTMCEEVRVRRCSPGGRATATGGGEGEGDDSGAPLCVRVRAELRTLEHAVLPRPLDLAKKKVFSSCKLIILVNKLFSLN